MKLLDKHYNYAIVERDDGAIKLFNKSNIKFGVTVCDGIEDVNVNIDENGILELTGNKRRYYFYSDETTDKDDLERIEERCVKERRKYWLFGRKIKYAKGWVLLKEREDYKLVTNKFTVRVFE